jgi:hypothetical protein
VPGLVDVIIAETDPVVSLLLVGIIWYSRSTRQELRREREDMRRELRKARERIERVESELLDSPPRADGGDGS